MRMAFEIDVRDVVPAINVPTLIVHAARDGVCHVENARFLARNIAGAKYVELADDDHVPWFDPDETLAEIREFLDGAAGGGDSRSDPGDGSLHRRRRLDGACGGARRPALARPARAAPCVDPARARPLRRARGGHGGRRVLRDLRRSGARRSAARRRSSAPCKPLDLDVRAGLHTGEVELADGKVAGIAVNIGARVAARADAWRGARLRHGAGPRRRLRARVRGSGTAALKGVPGEWRLFAVRD